MKRCSRCKKDLPRSDFYAQAKSRDGLQRCCKACTREGWEVWHAAQPPKPPKPPRVCVVCGGLCGARYKVCSEGCAKRRHAELCRKSAAKKRAARAASPPVLRPCARCGSETSRPKFCSDECARPKPVRRCACGVPLPGRGSFRFCANCKPEPKRPEPKVRYRRVTKGKIWMRVKTQPKPREFVAGDCPCCGESFVAFAWTGSQFCSPGCQRREERRRRRDVKRQSEKAEPIFRRKVYERDNWTCRLCKKPVAQDAVVPHPKAPTLDHILPLALGGSHTYTNVQCAHFICNSKKSANVIQLSFAA